MTMKLRDVPIIPTAVMGIPVRYDAECEQIAEAIGYWPLKSIRVGPLFKTLHLVERNAVLYHEAGHSKLFHAEKRLLASLLIALNLKLIWRVLCAPAASDMELMAMLPDNLTGIARKHETEADAFAVEMGFGHGLLEFLQRFGRAQNNPMYPHPLERIAFIQGAMKC